MQAYIVGIGVVSDATNPFVEFDDVPQRPALIRKIKLCSLDGNKYVTIQVNRLVKEIKSGYVYTKTALEMIFPARFGYGHR